MCVEEKLCGLHSCPDLCSWFHASTCANAYKPLDARIGEFNSMIDGYEFSVRTLLLWSHSCVLG